MYSSIEEVSRSVYYKPYCITKGPAPSWYTNFIKGWTIQSKKEIPAGTKVLLIRPNCFIPTYYWNQVSENLFSNPGFLKLQNRNGSTAFPVYSFEIEEFGKNFFTKLYSYYYCMHTYTYLLHPIPNEHVNDESLGIMSLNEYYKEWNQKYTGTPIKVHPKYIPKVHYEWLQDHPEVYQNFILKDFIMIEMCHLPMLTLWRSGNTIFISDENYVYDMKESFYDVLYTNKLRDSLNSYTYYYCYARSEKSKRVYRQGEKTTKLRNMRKLFLMEALDSKNNRWYNYYEVKDEAKRLEIEPPPVLYHDDRLSVRSIYDLFLFFQPIGTPSRITPNIQMGMVLYHKTNPAIKYKLYSPKALRGKAATIASDTALAKGRLTPIDSTYYFKDYRDFQNIQALNLLYESDRHS